MPVFFGAWNMDYSEWQVAGARLRRAVRLLTMAGPYMNTFRVASEEYRWWWRLISGGSRQMLHLSSELEAAMYDEHQPADMSFVDIFYGALPKELDAQEQAYKAYWLQRAAESEGRLKRDAVWGFVDREQLAVPVAEIVNVLCGILGAAPSFKTETAQARVFRVCGKFIDRYAEQTGSV